MAKIRVFEIKNGKVEFTKAELEKILNEVYEEGKADGKSELWAWSPTIAPFYYNNSISNKAETYRLDTTNTTNSAVPEASLEGCITSTESAMRTTTTKNPTIKTDFCDIPISTSRVLGSISQCGEKGAE